MAQHVLRTAGDGGNEESSDAVVEEVVEGVCAEEPAAQLHGFKLHHDGLNACAAAAEEHSQQVYNLEAGTAQGGVQQAIGGLCWGHSQLVPCICQQPYQTRQ
eukprot:scaffold39386_cov18-Tisochrysis_lutea.AAC.1